MALRKEVEVLGFQTVNYVKPTTITISEGEKIDGVRIYKVEMVVKFFTNDTEQYMYQDRIYEFKDLVESELILPKFYELLMNHPDFEGYNFV